MAFYPRVYNILKDIYQAILAGINSASNRDIDTKYNPPGSGKGNLILGVRNDNSVNTLVGQNEHYSPIAVDSNGRIQTRGIYDDVILNILSGGVLITNGRTESVSFEFQRPNNTPTYNPRVAVSTLEASYLTFTFSQVFNGYITKARIVTNNNSRTPRLRLHLFNADDVSTYADNTDYRILWAERAKRIGFIDFPALSTSSGASNASSAMVGDVRLQFKTDNLRQIYGVIETLDSFPADANQQYFIELSAECYR